MGKAEIQTKPFELLFSQERIQKRTRELGEQITRDYDGKKPLFMGILKGCVVFFADLIRAVSIPVEVEFMSAHSYHTGTAPGEMNLSGGSQVSLTGRHVLVVEGVVDTGRTLAAILDSLKRAEPASIEIVTLLNKTGRREVDLNIKYSGFHVTNDFVIGYGLDHNQYYRNLPFIGKVVE